jgi:hypothetical protein
MSGDDGGRLAGGGGRSERKADQLQPILPNSWACSCTSGSCVDYPFTSHAIHCSAPTSRGVVGAREGGGWAVGWAVGDAMRAEYLIFAQSLLIACLDAGGAFLIARRRPGGGGFYPLPSDDLALAQDELELQSSGWSIPLAPFRYFSLDG